jgi:raffinose/stachyose/melibiose transport system permease protein
VQDFHQASGSGADRYRRMNFCYKRKLQSWGFVLPILLLHAFVILVPVGVGVFMSFTNWTGIGEPKVVGLDNYLRLLDDENFRSAVLNNIKWLFFFWTVPFIFAILGTALLSQIKRGAFLFRLIYFIPYVLPSVVVGSLWKYLLHPDRGFPGFLETIGLPMPEGALLGQPETALFAVAFVDNWHYWGFLATLLLVAMQSVPKELYEAARIDGAGFFHQLVHVTIPGIRPTLAFMFMMTGIWSFLVFDYVWVMTGGGPAGSSEVLGTFIYRTAFRNFEVGYASAQGVVVALFALCILLIFALLRKRRAWDI